VRRQKLVPSCSHALGTRLDAPGRPHRGRRIGRQRGRSLREEEALVESIAKRRERTSEVDGDDSPCALDTELDEEGTGGEGAEGGGEVPEGEEAKGPNTGGHHRQSTSEVLRDVSSDDTSSDGSTVTRDRGEGCVAGTKSFSDVDVGRVEVLRSVTEEVKPSHEEDLGRPWGVSNGTGGEGRDD
jgi:hypothetical protein